MRHRALGVSLARLKEGIWVSWLMSEIILQGTEHELQRRAFEESLKGHFILGASTDGLYFQMAE